MVAPSRAEGRSRPLSETLSGHVAYCCGQQNTEAAGHDLLRGTLQKALRRLRSAVLENEERRQLAVAKPSSCHQLILLTVCNLIVQCDACLLN